MLKRAYFLLAVLWAVLILWLGSFEPPIQLHVWIAALGPLALIPISTLAGRYIVTGSPIRRR